MPPPAAVISRYGTIVSHLEWRLATAGYSGAAVWRGEGQDGAVLCLKAWPTGRMSPERLSAVHRLMNRAATSPSSRESLRNQQGTAWSSSTAGSGT